MINDETGATGHDRKRSSERAVTEAEATDETATLSKNVLTASLQYRQSQFPPLAEVKAYEKLSPGSWDRILVMAEKEQAAQIELNKAVLHFATSDQKRRQWLGSAISIIALAAAGILGFLHADWRIAVALVGVPVLAVAKALIDSARGHPDGVDK